MLSVVLDVASICFVFKTCELNDLKVEKPRYKKPFTLSVSFYVVVFLGR
jgi:hypothetical protein